MAITEDGFLAALSLRLWPVHDNRHAKKKRPAQDLGLTRWHAVVIVSRVRSMFGNAAKV